MNFLKRLFKSPSGPASKGTYVYIRVKRSQEIVRLYLRLGAEIERNYDGEGEGEFHARKTIVGSRSFDRIEAEFFFDSGLKLLNADIGQGGELASEADWLAQHGA
jgi:hypothetical protein